MTLAERMAMIDKKAENDKQKKETEAMALESYRAELEKWIRRLKPRIDELITLGNYAREHGINIGNCWSCEDYSTNSFISNGTSHATGFMEGHPITHLGILGGGGCGDWDFITDGETIIDKDHGFSGKTRNPSIDHLEKFVRDFPTLERRFYEYIEKVCETK